jgi:hypothetical protein
MDELRYDEVDGDHEIETFDVGLFPTSNGDFHTKNDPSRPFQRANVIERQGAVSIRCSCIDIIHGKMGGDSEDYASLIVLLFRFDPQKRARRIQHANIFVEFFSKDEEDARPEVEAISLDGRFGLSPTTQNEVLTKGVEGTAGGGALGLELSAGGKWEKTTTRDTSDMTVITGVRNAGTDSYGRWHEAQWVLAENSTVKTGVPAYMRVGILVKREEDKEFKADVRIEAKVDLKSSLEKLFGGNPPDDPILFKPNMKPTNKLMKYDTENLGSFDLESITDVTLHTIRDGAVKTITK